MLTPNGGVFGRNPKFNNVTVEQNLTVNGDFTLGDDIVISDTLIVNGQATFKGGVISVPNATAPTNNVVLGSTAGNALASGANDNVLIGSAAGDAISSGDQNVAIGTNALGAAQTSTNAVAIGHGALLLTTSNDNVAIGSGALDANTTGALHVAIGRNAGGAITTGDACTAIGWEALSSSQTGSANTAIGRSALANATGSTNTAVGNSSLVFNTTGGNNVALGVLAGAYLADGSSQNQASTDSVFIGSGARAGAAAGANCISIGDTAIGDGANTTVIGNASTTQARIRGATFLSSGANGQSTQLGQSTTLLSGLSGATVTATNLIPANCILLGVTARVTTAVTGATTFDIGDGSTADRFGNDIAVALDTTANNCIAPALIAAATNVVLTANGSNFTGGAVRLTAHFMALVAPTS